MMSRSRRHSRRTALALAGIVLALLTGCAARPTQEEQMDELAARPSLEQVVARYEEMMTRATDALSAELGPYTWVRADDADEASVRCTCAGARLTSMSLMALE